MKLSEAISLGATLGPQSYGAKKVELIDKVATCALGAAQEAIGSDKCLRVEFPFIRFLETRCPACSHIIVKQTLYFQIVHLNDLHFWTRERIAEWVSTVEPSDSNKERENAGTEFPALSYSHPLVPQIETSEVLLLRP